jgi:hypothetical protein
MPAGHAFEDVVPASSSPTCTIPRVDGEIIMSA